MKNTVDSAERLGLRVQELTSLKLTEFASRCYDLGLRPEFKFEPIKEKKE